MHKSTSSTDLAAQVTAQLDLAEHVIIPASAAGCAPWCGVAGAGQADLGPCARCAVVGHSERGTGISAGGGLQESTLRAWGLGWCPRDVFDPPERWGLTGKRIYVLCGVVIPHFVGDEWWALKIRRFVCDAPATDGSILVVFSKHHAGCIM
jgi:hypothetical protein